MRHVSNRGWMLLVLVLGALSAFGCVSGDDTSDDAGASAGDGDGDGDGEAGGAQGEVYAVSDTRVIRLSLADESELANIRHGLAVTALHVTPTHVLLGSESGTLLVLDPDTLEEQARIELGSEVEQIASQGEQAFVSVRGGGTSEEPPEIAHVDLDAGAEVSRFAAVEVSQAHEGLLVRNDELLVLVENGFGLARVSLDSETVTQRVALGEDPNDPDGPRGEFYGYGLFALAGEKLLVLDERADVLLSVDPDTFQLSAMLRVADQLADGGRSDLASNGEEAFLSLADQDRVLVFGGDATLERTLELPDGARAIAAKGSQLYLDADETFGDLVAVDAESGEVLARVFGVFADLIAAR